MNQDLEPGYPYGGYPHGGPDPITRPARVPTKHYPSSSSNMVLLQPDDKPRGSAKPKHRYFKSFCHTLRLDILYTFFAKTIGWADIEPPKVAYYRSRRLVLIHSLIHLVPVLGAIVLIYFNIWQYYIGGELAGWKGQDVQKLGALQFAAKLHELLMLASVGSIVFAFIRLQMVFKNGVTLGTILAGQQFSSINNLWSLAFWSTIYDARAQKKGAKHHRWTLVILITLSTLLGVSLGPSSANLMRPRLDWWPAGGSTFWLNTTQDALFSGNYNYEDVPASCRTYSGDYSCPYGDFNSMIAQRVSFWPEMLPMGGMPQNAYTRSPGALRKAGTLSRSLVSGRNRLLWPRANTISTIPIAAISDALAEQLRLWAYAAANSALGKRFVYRKDVSHSVDSWAPSIELYCKGFNGTQATASNASYMVKWANTSTGYPQNIYDDNGESEYPSSVELETTAEQTAWLRDALVDNSSSMPSVSWIDDASLLAQTNSSLLALAAFPPGVTPFFGVSSIYFGCNINAYLVPVTYQAFRNDPDVVQQIPRHGDRRAVFPTAAWASLTDPYLPAVSQSVFALMAAAAGISDLNSTLESYNINGALETVLATMIGGGMSNMPYRPGMSGILLNESCPDSEWCGGAWADQFMPAKELGFGGNPYVLTDDERARSTAFQMKARANGYAYSSEGITQKVAIAVLIVYCLLAVFYIVWNFCDGRYSEAWDTAPELTAVALNSERTETLKGAGAGIYSVATMEQKVAIRTKDDNIVMVFKDTQRDAEGVRIGQPYY